jgi:hypothetical protein
MVEKENNDIRQHNHEPMSNCEISVMIKMLRRKLKCSNYVLQYIRRFIKNV